MRVHLDFHDGATDLFLSLSTIGFGVVKQGLQQASSKLASTYRDEIENTQPTDWGIRSDSGNRRITLDDKKAKFGQKHSYKTGREITGKYDNIADHVTFYVPPQIDKMYAVVGGGHKAFYPRRYEKGVDKGRMGRVGGNGTKTLDILDKLNDGATVIVSEKMRGILARTSKNGKNLRNVPKVIYYKPRHFAERARSKGGQRAIESVRKLYEKVMPQAVNNFKPKITEVRTRA